MAGLVAAARLRQLGRERRCARRARASVARCSSRPASSSAIALGRFSAGVPRRRRGAAATRLGTPGRCARLADRPRCARRLGGDRKPGDGRQAVRPAGLVAALARAAGPVELGAAAFDDEPTILCTGGFAASAELVQRHIGPAAPLRLRANPWSTGDGLEHALARGAATSAGLGEFYGRNMPDGPWGEAEFVGASQLYARYARIFDERGDGVLRGRGRHVVGDERRPGDSTAARRAGVLPARRARR